MVSSHPASSLSSLTAYPSLKENMKKYIKMAKLRIPVQAIKLKMQSEGYDPSLLDVRSRQKTLSITPQTLTLTMYFLETSISCMRDGQGGRSLG